MNSRTVVEDELKGINIDMESVLSLSDETPLIKQPSTPPVLAQVQKLAVLDPSKVADPRPGPPKTSQGASNSTTYQHLHVVNF